MEGHTTTLNGHSWFMTISLLKHIDDGSHSKLQHTQHQTRYTNPHRGRLCFHQLFLLSGNRLLRSSFFGRFFITLFYLPEEEK